MYAKQSMGSQASRRQSTLSAAEFSTKASVYAAVPWVHCSVRLSKLRITACLMLILHTYLVPCAPVSACDVGTVSVLGGETLGLYNYM